MKIYLIAGENSGDFIGSQIISSLKIQTQDLEIFGVGGALMKQEGVKSLFPISEINLMGFFEVIPHIFKINKLINKTVEDIIEKQPQILITIDSPGFTYRVAKRLKDHCPEIKLIHIVAPSVWAYKPSRAQKYAKLYDHLLVLFPFEVPYFTKFNLPTTCIGHPIFQQNFYNKTSELKKEFTTNQNAKIITITPGSRLGEINRHMPIIVASLKQLALKHPIIAVFVQTNDDFRADIEKFLYDVRFEVRYTTDRLKAFAVCDCAIAKSGTNTFEIAASSAAMLTGYKLNWLSYVLIRIMIKIKNICLINIISGEKIIPELVQSDFNINNIVFITDKILSDPIYREQQIREAQKVLHTIGFQSESKASDLAAQVILGYSKVNV
ncbi:MAG: lipid-A-disaccharide synthase [Rickettsiaceae bacterium]|nr:lipid-A-disaccharide synthase [Rickettsiaceae bacterium]